jgi:subtilisin family serine protease
MNRIVQRAVRTAAVSIRALLAGGLTLATIAQPASAGGAGRPAEIPRATFLVVLDGEAVGLSHPGVVNKRRTVALTNRLAGDLSARNGLRPRAVLSHLGMFLVDATQSEAERLADMPGVALVQEDVAGEPSALPSCFSPTSFPLANSYDPISPQSIQCWDPQLNCTDSWALDRIDQRTGSEAAHTLDSKFYFGAKGSGVHIYLLDTGIAPAHSEFAGAGGVGTRIGNGVNFAVPGQCLPPPYPAGQCGDRQSWDTYDGNGHGTLVASVAAGRRFGVAKAAALHPVRIANDRGVTWTSWAALGLDWVAGNAARPAVVNLSANFYRDYPGDTGVLDTAASRLINNYGIAIVNSAGNFNQQASSFSPTDLPEVIVVAGLDWNNYSYGAGAPLSCNTYGCGSNWGPEVDLFAPAVDILGAMADALNSWACIGTGTSFAAPLVTGVVAQYLQGNPTATPSLIQTVLIERATTQQVLGDLRGSPNRLLFTNF